MVVPAISKNTPIVNLPEIIGKGYGQFWRDRRRYIVLKGGRASKKSCTTALRWIYLLLKYPQANLLVVRRYQNTHSNSTYAQLRWAARRLKVEHLFKWSGSSLTIQVKATGQQILFRGMDDPDSITSITVATGALCWVWIEEAYQVSKEDSFNKLDMSIRGAMPEGSGLWKQIVMTFNPWSDKIWIKKRFCDKPDPDVGYYTTNYMCNEFLDAQDRKLFEKMKVEQPHRYRIEGLGDWGIATGLVFNNWYEEEFDIEEVFQRGERFWNENSSGYAEETFLPDYYRYVGMDYGYSNDPTALIAMAVSEKERKIYVYDEHYQIRMSNQQIADMIRYKGLQHEKIRSESADGGKTNDEVKKLGIPHIENAEKGPGSIRAGIQRLQDYQIIVHPRCANTLIELSNYVWAEDKKTGEPTDKPIDEYNHLMDAMRYATETLGRCRVTLAKPSARYANSNVIERVI